jgi:preprotein translocase subunit SecD
VARPAGQFRPGRLIGTFVFIVAVLYALVFLTPGSNTPKLGIDLQGGTRITLTAQTLDGSNPSTTSMQQARNIMENRVNGSGVAGAQVQVEGNQLVVTIPGNANNLGELTRPARLNIRPQLGNPGYDGTALAAHATSTVSASGSTSSAPPTTRSAIGDTTTPETPSSGAPATTSPAAQIGPASGSAVSTPATSAASGQPLRNAAAATSGPATSAPVASAPASTPSSAASATTQEEPSTSPSAGASGSASATATSGAAATWPIAGSDPQNPNQPAGTDATAWSAWETAAQNAAAAGTISCANVEPKRGLDDANRPLIACGNVAYTGQANPCAPDVTTACVYVLDKTLIPGDQLDTAAAVIDSNSGRWVINVQFTSAGFNTWSNYTANHNAGSADTTGSYTAFTLDGEVLSSPQIQGAITTAVTQVSGSFTQASATDLANALKFGALPLNFLPGEQESVSAELGLSYLQAGLIAGAIGLLLVVIYCLVYYRLLGVITILSLVLSGALVYAIMTLLGRWIGLSLDMAGVAGLIVAIGITADSFVIYFERLKDEVREGRSFRSAVPRGWQRAIRTILSADVVTLISAVILYLVATGDVKGFAFTLGLSTVLDLVVVYLVTHPLVSLAAGAKVFQSPRLSGLGAVARAGAEHRAATAQLSAKEA